ncbi:MAG TPA: YggS family pyridoxal phosphate-dependent enzyme [Thermoanaerobaculia bacterium]|nr:YggS family pyridoxal phosphate-dependent enzyme [Thermoanaerobaculia bacterium]
MLDPEAIRENVRAVESRIAAACARAGRDRNDVLLIAVTKTFPSEAVDAAIRAGITDVGENRVQEARDKKPGVQTAARWHLIGHLQSNKARDAVRLFDVIQAVDSVELAEKIARAADAEKKRQEILIEVNVGREAQKNGVEPENAGALVKQLSAIPSLHLRGLMAIPPFLEADAMRPYFRELRKLREELALEQLSMGMSDDFEVAIEEGSTMVRVGRAIFGSRG